MVKVLLLRLEGPHQSWGSRARWDVRDTSATPTKSGIIGLLGCALGYGMGDIRLETDLDAGLRFGFRVEKAGTILQDFHTITGDMQTAEGKRREGTIISPRFYLEDAAFLVGLTERPNFDGLVDKCAAAVQHPVWPLFLGRKCCIPTRPVFEALTNQYTDLEHALGPGGYLWSYREHSGVPVEPPRTVSGSIETYGGARGAGDVMRQEAVRVNAARQYDFITMKPYEPFDPRLVNREATP
jgi:CRISPR system Cascade subunit CasD